MAGVGKSYISKKLADKLQYKCIEIDELITEHAEKIGLDKDLISDEEFIAIEEAETLSIESKNNIVVDTGGSVAYSSKAMDSLKKHSTIIYLSDTVENIKKRFEDRGEIHLIGLTPGKAFETLFEERHTLYEKYADITIDVSRHGDEQVLIDNILNLIQEN